MAFKYHHITRFEAGQNIWSDPKDIENNQLSLSQGVSVDKIGRIRTMGELVNHAEVGTQGAIICPGSGLKVFSSDHWLESSPTAVDLIATDAASDSAVSDRYGEVDDTSGWTLVGGVLTSENDGVDGIASNGTSYIFKYTGGRIYASFSTVIGQRYKASADLHCGTANFVWLAIGTGSSLPAAYNIAISSYHTAASWENRSHEFVAITTTTYITIGGTTPGETAFYADDVYVTEAAGSDLKGDWLALADVANAQVDLYSDNAVAFTAGLMDFGTVSTYVATADKINFPSTSTITDVDGRFLKKNMQRGQIWKISGATEAGNNILIMLEHVTAGTLYLRGTPLTVDADDNSTITFTKYNPTSLHFVNEALRASPVGGGVAVRPKHYSFVERIHFGKDLAGGDEYSGWYLNDVGPIAPTDQYVETTDSDGDRDITGNVDAGEGFEIAVTDNAAAADWPVGTWEVASSFIYDDGQESALYVPSTPQTFTTTEGSSQDIAVRAHNTGTDYDERISGGRAYCRKTLSDDAWVLLVDIDMKQGVRATLSGNYNAWAEGATTYVVYSDGFDSFRRNLATYESLTGRDSGVALEEFEADNTFWDTSVIAGNRCFLASARYTGKGGVTSYFRDRILYSEIGNYDVFPIDNYIDVVRGDADDYKKLVHFNDRIMAFKERNLFIVNISDNSPANWFLEETHYFRGILHPGAVFLTPHGVAWSNEIGAFLYDGSQVINLTDFKIDRDTWATFHTDYSIVGCHKKSDTLVVMGDCTLDGSGHGYFFDFTTQAWTYGSGIFDSTKTYTNWETDWNEDLIIGEESAGTVTIKKFSDTPASKTASLIDIRTKDINFGSEFAKIIDAIIITYKSSAIQTSAVKYGLNGAATPTTAFSPVGSFAVATAWTRLVIEPTAPITCYSFRLQVSNPTNTGVIEINDIAIRYQDVESKLS